MQTSVKKGKFEKHSVELEEVRAITPCTSFTFTDLSLSTKNSWTTALKRSTRL